MSEVFLASKKFSNNKPLLKEKKNLARFFWDVTFKTLDFDRDSSFIVGRVLAHGDWWSVCWVREFYGDKELKNWVLENRGRELDPRRLRYWQYQLGLPKNKVDAWIKALSVSVWGDRFIS